MLRTRILTAVALLAGFAVVLFLLPTWLAALVFLAATALAAWEWASLAGMPPIRRGGYAALVVVLCLLFWTRPRDGFFVLWLLSASFWLFFAPRYLRSRHLDVCPTIGLLLLLPAWAALVELLGKSPWLLLAVMAVAWVADIGAYFSGRAFGRHKLAPLISPGKTWEGVAGGVVAVLLYGFSIQRIVPELPKLPVAAAFAVLVGATALTIVGDLFESLAKRMAGVKDSGRLLPGHGGILDRIDSQLPLLPLAALALRWGG